MQPGIHGDDVVQQLSQSVDAQQQSPRAQVRMAACVVTSDSNEHWPTNTNADDVAPLIQAVCVVFL